MIENAGKRASTRVVVHIPVRYVQTGGAQGDAEINELSAGGCTITAKDLDPRGPDVFLHFRLGKDKQEIHLRARVIHIASHARFVRSDPLASGLRLADGWLTARDILNLRIGGATVVLSGCDTGRAVIASSDEPR